MKIKKYKNKRGRIKRRKKNKTMKKKVKEVDKIY